MMSDVYFLKEDGTPAPMKLVHCKDEEKELQGVLEKNYDLLPGNQIRPDDPCRWLLIKREMPVPDPGTGGNRWSIDFFFVDQSGMPTFIECKRFQDTRSRREVVGQMLEYAANGQYYWDRELLRDYASISVKPKFSDLEEAIRSLEPESGESVDDFLELIENNLREGQIRLIFFMEEAPNELKSIVDFLNSQMERSEVLIVEAKQYKKNGLKVIVPRLFGFTEEARRIKKSVTINKGERKKWNEEKFFEQARERLSSEQLEAVKRLYTYCKSSGFEIKWGTGKETGAFTVTRANLFPKSIISVVTKGSVYLNFGALRGNEFIESFRDDFAQAISEKLGVELPIDFKGKYPGIAPADWIHKVDILTGIIQKLIDKYEKT
jgi:hypothetical protein